MKKITLRAYYYNNENPDDVLVWKKEVKDRSVEDAMTHFLPEDRQGYTILNWNAIEKK